ncbi:hypothetical protein F5146DRAFT_1004188 [Armillaria mellea]|nr:hypothetical protein F5146DRAFT_1004188 [Armillaria mellea]
MVTPGVYQTVETSTESALTSGNVGLTFACSSTRGAGLALPGGTTRYDAEQPAQLYEYAKKYAQYWYQYFNGEEGREMRNGCLHFLCGYTISVGEKPMIHDQLLAKNTVIGGSKAGGPLIISPAPYDCREYLFQQNNSEDGADFHDSEDPEDVKGSSQVSTADAAITHDEQWMKSMHHGHSDGDTDFLLG